MKNLAPSAIVAALFCTTAVSAYEKGEYVGMAFKNEDFRGEKADLLFTGWPSQSSEDCYPIDENLRGKASSLKLIYTDIACDLYNNEACESDASLQDKTHGIKGKNPRMDPALNDWIVAYRCGQDPDGQQLTGSNNESRIVAS